MLDVYFPYGACAGMGDPRPQSICPQESNPEGYYLITDDPTFCKPLEIYVMPEFTVTMKLM